MVPWIQLLSMIGLIIFTGINLNIPGFWALGIGLLGNFLVIASNGGWMPISPETVSRITAGNPDYVVMVDARLGYSKDWVMDLTNTRLPWLSDIFTLPAWCPYKVAFSLGDVFIFIGAVLVLWSLSNEVKEEQ
jgi:hypothetical protein